MKLGIPSVLACLLVTSTAFAQEPVPVAPEFRATDESIHHLLDVAGAKKIVEAMSQQVDSMYAAMLTKLLEGKDLTSEQQQQIQARQAKARALVTQMLSWDSMEHLYMKIYAETFTQSEIDGITAFYASPAGQAVIVKMPMAMKNSMSAVQEQMKSLIPQLQQMAKETAEQIKSEDASKPKAKAS